MAVAGHRIASVLSFKLSEKHILRCHEATGHCRRRQPSRKPTSNTPEGEATSHTLEALFGLVGIGGD